MVHLSKGTIVWSPAYLVEKDRYSYQLRTCLKHQVLSVTDVIIKLKH